MIWLFKWLFFPEWEVVWMKRYVWDIVNNFTDKKIVNKEYCYFQIHWSKYRKKYKITMHGYKPELHHSYPDVIKEIIRFRAEEPFRYKY